MKKTIDEEITEKIFKQEFYNEPKYSSNGNIIGTITPNYSTNIQDAFLIIDKMNKKGYTFILELKDMYYAVFYKNNIFIKASSSHSASMAICLAALKTI